MSGLIPNIKRKFNEFDNIPESLKKQEKEDLTKYLPKEILLEIFNNCIDLTDNTSLRLVDRRFNKVCDHANYWIILHDKERGGIINGKRSVFELNKDLSPLDSYFSNRSKAMYYKVTTQNLCGMMDLSETRGRAQQTLENQSKLEKILKSREAFR